MLTHKQQEGFYESVILDNINKGSLVESAIEWIQLKLHPEDVFDKEELAEWAEANGYRNDR